jgi:hypothetical protein
MPTLIRTVIVPIVRITTAATATRAMPEVAVIAAVKAILVMVKSNRFKYGRSKDRPLNESGNYRNIIPLQISPQHIFLRPIKSGVAVPLWKR